MGHAQPELETSDGDMEIEVGDQGPFTPRLDILEMTEEEMASPHTPRSDALLLSPQTRDGAQAQGGGEGRDIETDRDGDGREKEPQPINPLTASPEHSKRPWERSKDTPGPGRRPTGQTRAP